MRFFLSYVCLVMVLPLGADYMSISQIRPGQARYSSLNVDEKVKLASQGGFGKAPVVLEDPITHIKTFAFDNGKSIVDEKNALPVIKGPNGIMILVDGHHDVLASIKLGATTVPVKIVEDLSTLSQSDFFAKAESKNYIYPFKIGGERIVLPTSFGRLEDDPYRFFATLILRICKAPDISKSSELPNDQTFGAEYPVGIKVGKDIPFMEFKISDVLNNHMDSSDGIVYTNAMGKNIPEQLVEKARKTLKEHPIPGFRLVPNRVHYNEIPHLCKYEYQKVDRGDLQRELESSRKALQDLSEQIKLLSNRIKGSRRSQFIGIQKLQRKEGKLKERIQTLETELGNPR